MGRSEGGDYEAGGETVAYTRQNGGSLKTLASKENQLHRFFSLTAAEI